MNWSRIFEAILISLKWGCSSAVLVAEIAPRCQGGAVISQRSRLTLTPTGSRGWYGGTATGMARARLSDAGWDST